MYYLFTSSGLMDSCTMITHIYEDCFTGARATLPWGQSRVWWCYNAINFIPNPHSRHPIARPWGRGMGCLLWVNSDFSSNAVIALLCVISWYVAPHFNKTPDVWYLTTTKHWNPQYSRPSVECIVLRVQVLRCGWLWVGYNLYLLLDYICLLYP